MPTHSLKKMYMIPWHLTRMMILDMDMIVGEWVDCNVLYVMEDGWALSVMCEDAYHL